MIIDFDEETHTYSVDGDIAYISVTELLSKHGLAPNYKGANKEKLKVYADIGKEVHKDLENVLNVKKYKPTTEQGIQYQEWVKNNLDCGIGEQKLAYKYGSMYICGTADIMAISKSGERIVADHKNTTKFHREYVSWQVSILDYFARKLNNEPINRQQLHWKGATKFYCFHYNPKSGDMEVIELEKVPDKQIENLLECERQGKIYQRPSLVVPNELRLQFEKAEQFLLVQENIYKQAKQQAEEMRAELCELFEAQGIKSWESPNGLIKVTYVEPIDKITLDSKKVKEKYPQVFMECQKLTQQKGSIRIKNKGENIEEF